MRFPVWSTILGHSVMVVELKNSTKISSAEKMERSEEGQNSLSFCCVITTKKSSTASLLAIPQWPNLYYSVQIQNCTEYGVRIYHMLYCNSVHKGPFS